MIIIDPMGPVIFRLWAGSRRFADSDFSRNQVDRSHRKSRILFQGRGEAKHQPSGILQYFEDLMRGLNTDIGPKDILEIASK